MAVIISWQESGVPASWSTWAAASRALSFWDLASLRPARRRGVALGVPLASAGVAVVAGVVAWPDLPFLRVVVLMSATAAAHRPLLPGLRPFLAPTQPHANFPLTPHPR